MQNSKFNNIHCCVIMNLFLQFNLFRNRLTRKKKFGPKEASNFI